MKLPITIILAEDDEDDIMLFKESLAALKMNIHLILVQNGEELMKLLYKNEHLIKMIFLDVNMPRKNGLACLTEIKQDEKLQSLPVIMLSTSSETKTVRRLYETGAQYFIQKPNEFEQLKNLIKRAITLVIEGATMPAVSEFILRQQVLTA